MTDKEIKKYLELVGYPAYLKLGQQLTILWWSFFNRKKLEYFCEQIAKGKSLHFAFKDTKQY